MEQERQIQIWSTVLDGFRLGVFEDPVAAAKSLCLAHDFLFGNPLPASASPAAEVPLTEAIPAQPAEIAEADLPDTGIKAEDIPEPMPEPEPEFEKMLPPDDEPESNAYDGPNDGEKFIHPEVTKDMVREKAVKAGARLGRGFVVDQFASFGATCLNDLDPKYYLDAYKAFSDGE